MREIELKKELADREAAYRLLSACYYQPSFAWKEAKLFSKLAGIFSTVEVLRYYREAGLDLDADFTEMPDHIAVELEFVSYLLQEAVASVSDAGLKLQLGRGDYFHATFLAPWCGQLCGAIRSNTDNRFYVALADCTELLVSQGLPFVAA